MKSKNILIIGTIILAVAVIGLVISQGTKKTTSPANSPAPNTGGQTPTLTANWRQAEFTNVKNGEKFTIDDFKGKTVLLESFAVWCPTCLKQQKEMDKLKELDGKEIIHISLDTDPNENRKKVAEHLERNGFDWYFAVSPIEVTRLLTDEFGIGFVNAPSAPVVLICEDGGSRFLGRGVKDVEELTQEIKIGCTA